jgi:hypothetical protein
MEGASDGLPTLTSVYARTLTQTERATLLRLLPSDGFSGVDEYRAQVEQTTVAGRCPCGCPTIDLQVDRSRAPRSPVPGTPLLPVEAELGEGEDYSQLILFARDGWLESLELVYYSEVPPTELPDPGAWRIVRREAT